MSAISSNTPRTHFADNLEVFASLPVSNVRLYEGAFVGVDTNGDLVNLSGTTYPFVGVLMEEVDNSAGSAGAVKAKVKIGGIVEVAVTGVNDHDDVNKPVYSANNNDLTLTATSAAKVGRVVAWSGSSTLCRVKLDSVLLKNISDLSAIAALTDNTAGTANDTLQALADGTTWANDVAAVRNNFADLAAKVNAILAALKL